MAADVNDTYSLVNYICNKNMQGFLPPAKFNLIINQGQRSYMSWALGAMQDYVQGRPVAKVELGNNLVLRNRLAPVILQTTLTVDVNGNADYPSDYLQSDAMWTATGFKRVRIVGQERLSSFYNSTIDPIATNPIYLLEDTKFQFYPVTLTAPLLSYVSNPPTITWGYTTDVNGRPVYDSGTSAQPVWDIVSMYDVIARSLLMVGVNLQSQQVAAYANEIIKQGQ